MYKALLAVVGFVVIIGALAFTLMSQAPKEEQVQDVDRYRTSLEGEYVCLPHVNTTGPQTDECAFGLKTDGTYYAVDMYLMSQTPPSLKVGDRFSANGVVTPVEMLSTDQWRQYPVVGIFSVTDSVKKIGGKTYECDGDGKMCPDGSIVGRTGPSCEFAACPPADAREAVITTSLGQKMTALNLSITPKEVISDSRCPEGVQCIWAGTVEVKAVVASQVGHGEPTFKLGEARPVDDYTVTLREVTPYPKEGEVIAESAYRFIFIVQK